MVYILLSNNIATGYKRLYNNLLQLSIKQICQGLFQMGAVMANLQIRLILTDI